MKESDCGCRLPDDIFGMSGWHWTRAGNRWCWSTRFAPGGLSADGRRRSSFLKIEEHREDDGSREIITSCNCTQRRELYRRGSEPIITAEEPACPYAGRLFVVERCPAYVRAMRDADGEPYAVHPDDPLRVMAPGVRRDRAKRKPESTWKQLDADDYGRIGS